MSIVLEQGLIFLVFTTIVVLLVVSVYLVKFLINLANLTKNLDETTVIVKEELEPTIKELNKVLVNVNKVAEGADLQMHNAKKLLSKLLGVTGTALGGLKTIGGSFVKGFFSAIKFFLKK